MSRTAVAESPATQLADALAPLPDAAGWLAALHAAGREAFSALGLPTTRQEDWRFTDIRPIAETAFVAPPADVAPELAQDRLDEFTFAGVAPYLLVFVDGHYAPALSSLAALPKGVIVTSLATAWREHDGLLREHVGSVADPTTKPFTALNAAGLADGALIRIPRDTCLDAPIHLLHLTSGTVERALVQPRVLVIADAGAEATVIESYSSLREEGCAFTNAVTEIVGKERSRIDHYRMQRENGAAFHVSATQIRLERDARLTSHAISLGGRLSRHEIKAVLAGENIDCTLNGLYLGRERQHVDNQTTIEHAAPHCRSSEVYKGILDDQAAGVFNGKIYVHPQAQLTDARQTNRALLLSKRAQINTKPELMIYADDVKCTHGATIGQLDEEALFYLRTRGISVEGARAMLTCAFGGEAIDDMRLDAIRTAVEAIMLTRFQR